MMWINGLNGVSKYLSVMTFKDMLREDITYHYTQYGIKCKTDGERTEGRNRFKSEVLNHFKNLAESKGQFILKEENNEKNNNN